MLKILPNSSFGSSANLKCGEIYCHSSSDFTIFCTLCELKSFNYEDFLLHFKNTHFENDLLKTEDILVEVTPFITTGIKDEYDMEDSIIVPEFMEEPHHDGDWSDAEEEQTGLRLVKWDEKETQDIEESNECSEDKDDDDYKPPKCQDPQTKLKATESQTPTYNCEICPRSYKNETNLRLHMVKFHNPNDENITGVPQMQKCDDCGNEFKTLRSLEEHSLAEHGGMKCTHCDKRFTSRTNQQRHIEIHVHGNERTFVCDYENCTKRFFTRRQCQSHKRTHTRSKNYVCDQCGYTCRVPEMLKVHYRSHTGEKPFACDVCGKCFVSKSAVKEHKSSHETERTHVCKVCGRTFARAKSLYHHKFLHLEEKKFKCKVCGQAYAQLAGLAGHMRRHRQEGPC